MNGDGDFWDRLDDKYRVVLCDLWGVVHDGVRLYPYAAERLTGWRRDGRKVILVTNAPRTADVIERQLGRIGLPRDAWDGISTGGEAGNAALLELGRPVGFLGTAGDRVVIEGHGVPIADGDDFTDLACSGMEEGRWDAGQYDDQLEHWIRRGVTMHCLNPDRLVIYGGVPVPCAGALADRYEQLGGRVCWYGKPHETIYRHALHLAGDPPREAVLAVGDGLETDILGAARMGFDAVFVTGGIHGGEPFPEEFARRYGLHVWRPVAVVDGLA